MHSHEQVIASLPEHLRPFVARQDYDAYTPRDHAIWRFLLQQLNANLKHSAHPTYFEGLAATGIGLDAIPRIEEMNACLSKLGWRAVVVDGFLPPAVFMEFQAIKVLVIAVNIRSFEHMLYTPAPDIVHESAGHAPFLIDIDYAEFLQRFGECGMQAIASKADWDVYEAVRELSIVKERADASPSEIAAAEARLEAANAANSQPSEAALLSRLHWWTVEYGLVGELQNYEIFGAGLLSSLGESQSCLDDTAVKKLPLTVNAIHTPYQITDPQPQLFVTESCRHLSQVLEEFSRHMCCHRGGASALQEAVEAGSVNTATTNAGLQISGRFSRVITDAVGNAVYFNTEGPSQLAYQGKELSGHGIDYHKPGFGSPVGRLRAFERCLSCYTVDELKRHHIVEGERVVLNFLSGIMVDGKLSRIVRRDQKNLIFSFQNCTVKDEAGHILFEPDWGTYDMSVGDQIVSVEGGSADQHGFPLYDSPSQKVTQSQQYDAATQAQFEWYQKLGNARTQGVNTAELDSMITEISNLQKADWLLTFEALELAQQQALAGELQTQLRDSLIAQQQQGPEDVSTLIGYGLSRLGL
ncbi:MAG: aromatic amino acid hydroxylase [Gammaproteobacteria bacterium]|nr:aromatic amino acid hydroxylase [Gammaproteobacteria bacterium]